MICLLVLAVIAFPFLQTNGLVLLPDLTAALDALGRLGKGEERCLRVAAPMPLCQLWLAGRLLDFMAEHQGVTVELIPRNEPDDSLKDIDVWIGWTESKGFNKENASPHFREEVFPVCSPNLLPDGRPTAGMTPM